jgi:predicted MFS family arabinose efflux permease
MGNFGSLVFAGLSCGSLFASFIVGKIEWKNILCVSMVGNGVGLFIYSLSSEYHMMCFARFLSGFNQIFIIIYIPLYIDAFSKKEAKSMWMSSVLLAPTLGVMIGFGLTAFTISVYDSWRFSFHIQSLTMIFSFIILCTIPTKYFDI